MALCAGVSVAPVSLAQTTLLLIEHITILLKTVVFIFCQSLSSSIVYCHYQRRLVNADLKTIYTNLC